MCYNGRLCGGGHGNNFCNQYTSKGNGVGQVCKNEREDRTGNLRKLR